MNFEIVCLDTDNPSYLFDFGLAPDLLFYSYIPIALLSLIFGFGILYNRTSSFSLHHKIFFLITLIFSLHIINELMQWVAVPAGLIYFGWSLVPLFHTVIAIGILYFSYVFTKQKDVSGLIKILFSTLLVPVILFLPTKLNISGFDLLNCDAYNGNLWIYVLSIKIVIASLLLYLIVHSILLSQQRKFSINTILYSAAFIFIIVFFGAEQIGYYTNVFEFNLIGPLGMLIFLMLITYLIVRYKAFNIKLAGAQALIFALVILVGSLLFVAKSDLTRLISGFTLSFIVLTGYLLLKSIQHEIKQREEIQKLAKGLEKANTRLRELDKQKSEFVSIASHQLRSPLTAMRGYASMLIEGSFGPVSDKQKEVLTHIKDSGKIMANSIEDYLSISRIESGNMKYELSDFNLKELSEQLVDELRSEAMAAGLLLLFKTDLTGQSIVHADKGKTFQIVHSLINNAIKYTPKGTITVLVRDDIEKKKIFVEITDTGIGMNQATLAKLFEKFSRAENANQVNIRGTGLGLYVARALARAMGGEVNAASEGDGKGSTFTFSISYVL